MQLKLKKMIKQSSKKYIGIDVGAKGAMTILSENGEIEFCNPFESVRIYSQHLKKIEQYSKILIGIEKVASMPNQGVKSMFSFGQRFGELLGMCDSLELSYILVPPKTWQRACMIPSGSDKKTIAEYIQRLYPEANLYGPKGGLLDGIADSIGIAHYVSRYDKGLIK